MRIGGPRYGGGFPYAAGHRVAKQLARNAKRSRLLQFAAMFETLTNRMGGVFTRLRGKGRLSDSDVDEALREVRLALLEADVNLNVTKALIARIRERAVGEEVHGSLTPGQQVIKIVNEELIGTLGSDAVELTRPQTPPLRILMVGLQGSG